MWEDRKEKTEKITDRYKLMKLQLIEKKKETWSATKAGDRIVMSLLVRCVHEMHYQSFIDFLFQFI